MTAEQRFERTLPTILDDLYLGPMPDYRDDLLWQTARTSQRPAWRFPGRWLPMADLATRSAVAPRLPWRVIATALIILTLLIGAAAVYVGTHQTRLPAPFGPAANGLIPYTANGDIYLGDPATGQTRLLVSSPERESGPVTSPDGTQVAFARDVPGTTATDVWVIGTDGSNLRKITPHPIDMLIWGAFTPDGKQLALIHRIDGPVAGCVTTVCQVARLDLFDADGSGKSKTIATVDGMTYVQFRPPDGREILYRARVDGRWGLFVMDADGNHARAVDGPAIPSAADYSYRDASYTAGGDRIFVQRGSSDANTGYGCCQLWVMNADGTDAHEFMPPAGPQGAVWRGQPAVSPDGSKVAFWSSDSPYVLVAKTDGSGQIIHTGPPLSGTAHWVWSPDSTKILMFPNGVDTGNAYLLDPAGGPYTTVPWQSNGDLDWQRKPLP